MTNDKMTFAQFKIELEQTQYDIKLIKKNIRRINKSFNLMVKYSDYKHITPQIFFEETCTFEYQRNLFKLLHSLIEKYYGDELSKMNLYKLQSYFDFDITSS